MGTKRKAAKSGEIIDLKMGDFLITPQEAKDYHNSFNKVIYRNTFKDEGADGVNKTPKDFTKGTGEYKIEEYVIEESPLVNDDASSDNTSSWTKVDATLTFDTDHYNIGYVATTQHVSKFISPKANV